jgi:hypothetical protein
MMILINSSDSNYENNNFKYNRYTNVISYEYSLCVPELKIYCDDSNINNNNKNNDNNDNNDYYFIFDSPGSDAFAHWIYESFIFFSYFFNILKKFPNIKILTKNTKKYVKNIFTYFEIKNDIVYNVLSTNNICFFPPVISLNDKKINISLYNDLLLQYINYIKLNVCYEQNNNILLLPRNTIDNYKYNDRYIANIEDIKKNILILGGVVINTYEMNNIKKQFDFINNSNIIILDYGSSYLVNCIFLNNKKIIVLDEKCLSSCQINGYESIKILHNIISKNNNVLIIKPSQNNKIEFSDINKYL